MQRSHKKVIIIAAICLIFLLAAGAIIFMRRIRVEGSTITIPNGFNTVHVQICENNIIRVVNNRFGIKEKHTQVIEDKKWEPVKVSAAEDPNYITMKTDKMIVRVNKRTKRISVADESGRELVKEKNDSKVYYKGVELEHGSGDKFYGISGYSAGDNSSDKLLRDSIDHVQAGTQGYSGGPFVWSTNGYGVLVDSNGGMFTMDDSKLEFYQSSRKNTEYYVFIGKPEDIMKSVAQTSGHSPMFPKWAVGFTNSQWGIDEKQLINIVDEYRRKNIPIDNYTLDFDWKSWGQDNYGEFTWNAGKFPDAASGELKRTMDSKGIKITGIMKPRIHVNTVQGKYAEKNKLWFPGSATKEDYFSKKPVRELNFASAKCRSWFFDHCKKAIDFGIAGWWNDEADEIGDNFQFMNMQKAMYEGQRSYNDKRVWSINRNFYLGSQRYAYGMWSGDISTGFSSMQDQRQRMLSAINIGETKWGMDTGGFNGGDPTPQNYARWVEFSAFTPIFRVHGNQNCLRQPWVFGETAEAAAAKAIRLRYSLIPYIYSYERKSYESGVGIVKPLLFDYPDDKNAENYVNAWMFGDYMLVSPVLDEDAESVDIYLPKGTWIDYSTGNVYSGGQTIKHKVNNKTWDDIPIFIKKGALIPNQDVQNYVGEKPVTNVYVDAFPSSQKTDFNYYDDDGETYKYEKGVYFKQNISLKDLNNSAEIVLSDKTGTYTPDTKYYIFKIHGRTASDVLFNGVNLNLKSSYDDLMKDSSECFAAGKDKYGDVVYVKIKTGEKGNITIDGSKTSDY